MRDVERVRARVSFADLQRMPDNGSRYELYDGELRVVPSPLPRHQIVCGRLYEMLLEYRRRSGGLIFLAPFDIVLSEFDVVRPDLVYFAAPSARRIRLDEHVRFPPDLAIEILSPSTARIDRGRKRELLARYGVPELWIVDPDGRRVEVSVLRDGCFASPLIVGGGRLDSPTLSGLTIDVTSLFQDLEGPGVG